MRVCIALTASAPPPRPYGTRSASTAAAVSSVSRLKCSLTMSVTAPARSMTANLWQERVELMQLWADKIDQLRASSVVAIKVA